jgi:hypothetical protein
MPVTFVPFFSPAFWQPDGGDHGPNLADATNAIPVHSGWRPLASRADQASVVDGPITGAFVHIYQQQRIVQYARPSADTTPGIWQPSTGTALFSTVNEAQPDDGGFIYCPNAPAAAVAVLALSPVTNPAATSGHVLHYRYLIPAAAAGTWTLKVELLIPGPTVILTDTVTGTSPVPGAIERDVNLTTVQAAAIGAGNYGALSLRFTATVPGTVQALVPAADNSVGSFVGDASQSPLFPILAAGQQTAHWITSPLLAAGGATATYVCQLTTGADPTTRLYHVLKYEYLVTNGGVTAVVSIYQGSTLIVADTLSSPAAGAWVVRTLALTAAQAALITDYTQLSAQIAGSFPADATSTVTQVQKPASLGSNSLWAVTGPSAWQALSDGSNFTWVNPQSASASLTLGLGPNLQNSGVNSGHVLKLTLFGPAGTSVQAALTAFGGGAPFASLNFPCTAAVQTVSVTLFDAQAQAMDAVWTNGLSINLTLTVNAGTDAQAAQIFVYDVELDEPAPRKLQVSYLEFDAASASQARVTWANLEVPDPNTSYAGDVATIYAGSKTKLYRAATSGFTDVSAAGGYSAGNARSAGWWFAQLGPGLAATNYVDAIQFFATAAATPAVNLITDPTPAPQARFMAIVKNQLVLADINLTNHFADEVWWSAVNNFQSFTPSVTTQAGGGRIVSTPGQIMGLVGGDYGIIFKRKAIHSMTWTGNSYVFQIQTMSRSVGTPFPRSVVAAYDAGGGSVTSIVYFWGGDSFYKTDGYTTPQKVGDAVLSGYMSAVASSAGAVDESAVVDMATEDQMMVGAYDRATGLILWFYTSVGDAGIYKHSRGVVYDPVTDMWAPINVPGLNLAYVCEYPNVVNSDTHLLHGSIAFAWDGTKSTWFKFSGNSYQVTWRTQRRAIGMDKPDQPIGARTRGFTTIQYPVRDYPTETRVREVLPVFTDLYGNPAFVSTTGPSAVPLSITIEVSNDPLVRPGSGSYRSATIPDANHPAVSEAGWYRCDELAGFWWRFSVTAGPIPLPRTLTTFLGLYVSWETRPSGGARG